MIYNRQNEIALLREEMKSPAVAAVGLQMLEGLLHDYSEMTDKEFEEFMLIWSYEVEE